MGTDRALVREVVAAAIDACEAAERLGLEEVDRALPTGADGVVVWEVMTSAWTYPESVRYAGVRAWHRLGDDAPYRPELARVLQEAAGVCAELVGASRLDDPLPAAAGRPGNAGTIRELARPLPRRYRKQMVPHLGRAASGKGGGGR